MKKGYFLFGIFTILILILIFSVNATQPTQNTNKIFLNPFYRLAMTNGQNYTYNFTFSPPDGLSSVSSAIINFQVYLSPTVTFTLWVNNKSCNNPDYVVSTTFSGAGLGTVMFDCSNIINRTGTYQVTLRPTQANTGAVTGWIDLTYMNNPQGSLTIHGTEYIYGQTGKVWLQLLDSNGSAVNTAVCYADIYTPSGGYLVEGATMTNMVHDGIYYYDLAIPIISGVYPAIAKCYYQAGQNPRNATTYVLTTGTVNTGTIINNTWILDGVYLSLKTDGGGGNNRMNATFNFSDFYSVCGNVSELLTTGLTIYWNGQWITGRTNHDIYIYTYNYTSSSWINLSNRILGGSNTATLTVTNSFSTTNFTKLLGVNSTNPLRVKFADNANAEGTKDWKTDYLYASCDQLSNPQWQQVMGSSELHVSSNYDYQIETTSFSGNGTTAPTIPLQNGTNITDVYYTGVFQNTFNIQSGVSTATIETIQDFFPFHSLPCNSILGLYQLNQSSGKYIPINFSNADTIGTYQTQWHTQEGHCSINFPVNLTNGGVTYYIINGRNVWGSDTRSTNTGFGALYPLLNSGCELWQLVKGYPQYVTPKVQTFDNGSFDYYYRACNNWYDDYYWFSVEYNQSLTDRSNIQDEDDYLQYESNYYSLKFTQDKLAELTNYLISNLLAVGQYSALIIANPLGNYTDPFGHPNNVTNQQYWANQATIYKNFQIINASCGTGVCRVNGTDVWTYPNRTLTSINVTVVATIDYNQLALNVWNSTSRNLTFYNNSDNDNYTLIAQNVWEYVSRNLTYTPDMTNYLQIQNMIWNFTNRSLTFYNNSDSDNISIDYNLLAQTVWNFSNRNLTYYNLGNNLSASDVWNYVSRNLTFYFDTTNYSLITENIWGFNNRSLTLYQVNNLTALDIWSFSNRSLTENISQEVWLYQDRNLTYFPYNNISTSDIWSYFNRSLTEDIPLEIWTYNNRTLTENISFDVWSYYNKTLTFYPDVTNYDLIFNGVWNYTNGRNLTFYPDVTNYSLISQLINNRTDIVNYSLIQQMINNRTDIVNYTLISQLINSLNITDFTNYSLIDQMINNRTDIVNYSLIDNLINNRTDIVNYTLINQLIQNLNVSDKTNYTLINEMINGRTDIVNYSLIDNLINNRTDIINYTLINQIVQNLSVTDLTNYTLINELINNRTDIINYSLIDQLINNRNDIVNYTLINQIVHTLNLTETDMTNYTLINNLINNRTDIINYSMINQLISNRSDLTNYTLVQSLISTYSNNLTAQMIWEYTTRNLTYINFTNAVNLSNINFSSVTNITPADVWSYVNINSPTTLGYYIWNYGNRTLSFHLDVACPYDNVMDQNMNCLITARIEDPSTDEKEVNFNCYILDTNTSQNYSEQMFSQMVNHTGVTISRDFFLPYNWANDTLLRLQCEATYEIFGFPNTNKFYTTFMARALGPNVINSNGLYIYTNQTTVNPGVSPALTGSVLGFTNVNLVYFFIIVGLLVILAMITMLALYLKRKQKKKFFYRNP